jgi:hypothetical protein
LHLFESSGFPDLPQSLAETLRVVQGIPRIGQ